MTDEHSPTRTADPYWTRLVAGADDQRRGQALADAVDQLRRAAAATASALEGETRSERIEVLKRAMADLAGARRALEALQ